MVVGGFLLGYLLLGALIAYSGGRRTRRWHRFAAAILAANLPLLLWLLFAVKDAIAFDRPVFDLESESGRFGFYNGLMFIGLATPIWLFGALVGSYFGGRKRSSRS